MTLNRVARINLDWIRPHATLRVRKRDAAYFSMTVNKEAASG